MVCLIRSLAFAVVLLRVAAIPAPAPQSPPTADVLDSPVREFAASNTTGLYHSSVALPSATPNAVVFASSVAPSATPNATAVPKLAGDSRCKSSPSVSEAEAYEKWKECVLSERRSSKASAAALKKWDQHHMCDEADFFSPRDDNYESSNASIYWVYWDAFISDMITPPLNKFSAFAEVTSQVLDCNGEKCTGGPPRCKTIVQDIFSQNPDLPKEEAIELAKVTYLMTWKIFYILEHGNQMRTLSNNVHQRIVPMFWEILGTFARTSENGKASQHCEMMKTINGLAWDIAFTAISTGVGVSGTFMSGPIKGLEKLQAQHGILEPLSGEALAKATEDTFPYTHNSAMGRIAGVLFVTSSTIPGPLRTAMTFSKDVIELHTGGYGEVKAESTDGFFRLDYTPHPACYAQEHHLQNGEGENQEKEFIPMMTQMESYMNQWFNSTNEVVQSRWSAFAQHQPDAIQRLKARKWSAVIMEGFDYHTFQTMFQDDLKRQEDAIVRGVKEYLIGSTLAGMQTYMICTDKPSDQNGCPHPWYCPPDSPGVSCDLDSFSLASNTVSNNPYGTSAQWKAWGLSATSAMETSWKAYKKNGGNKRTSPTLFPASSDSQFRLPICLQSIQELAAPETKARWNSFPTLCGHNGNETRSFMEGLNLDFKSSHFQAGHADKLLREVIPRRLGKLKEPYTSFQGICDVGVRYPRYSDPVSITKTHGMPVMTMWGLHYDDEEDSSHSICNSLRNITANMPSDVSNYGFCQASQLNPDPDVGVWPQSEYIFGHERARVRVNGDNYLESTPNHHKRCLTYLDDEAKKHGHAAFAEWLKTPEAADYKLKRDYWNPKHLHKDDYVTPTGY